MSIDAELAGEMAIEELIVIAERSASCEVYGLVKRHGGPTDGVVEPTPKAASIMIAGSPRHTM
ncbi:MAG: hypothetical protein H0V78_12295 [Burkholderiales bacterium]|nr:hypothetical protein [Burkholderiales bacterium]